MAFVDSDWAGRFVDYVVRSGIGSTEEVLDVVRGTLTARFGEEAPGLDLWVRRAAAAMKRRVEPITSHATTNDRIEAALDSLRSEGRCTVPWPVNKAAAAIRQATKAHPGAATVPVVFLVRADVQKAMDDQGLWLRCVDAGEAPTGEPAALAETLAARLRTYGVGCKSHGDKGVFIAPFRWAPRRLTSLDPMTLTGDVAPTPEGHEPERYRSALEPGQSHEKNWL